MSDDTTKPLQGTIRVDEEQLQGHVDQAVRTSVEKTLNTMLEAEAVNSVGRTGMSGHRTEPIRVPGTTTASSKRRPAR